MAIPQRNTKGETDKRYAIYKKDGTITKTIEERQERWAGWIETCFRTPSENEEPIALYIKDEMRGV